MNQYLVEEVIEGETYFKIMNPREIFNAMDMSDCYDITVYPYLLKPEMPPIPCRFCGTWHDGSDPLKMKIETIYGEVLDIGYGTDH